MKKITLLFLAFLAVNLSNAQDTCATAVVITAGTTTVGPINGTLPDPDCAPNAGLNPRSAGEWYSYTPASDAVVTINTDLPVNAGGDTRLHVYTGTCAALTCYDGADDVDGTNFLTTLTFLVSAGTTYYIAWDDQWSATGFDFELIEETFDCGIYGGVPYAEVYDDNVQFLGCFVTEDLDGDGLSWITQQNLDLDGDMTIETFATNASAAATTLMKDDWLITPGIALTGGTEYQVTSSFNVIGGATQNASLEAFVIDAQASTGNQIATLFSNTGIATQGMFETLETMAYQEMNTFTPGSSGTYYIAYRSFAPGDTGFVLLFDTTVEETLSVSEFDNNMFTHFYNKDLDKLTLNSSSLELSSIEMHNILGQNVLNKTLAGQREVIDMANLKDGIYLAKVSIQGKSEIIKILKQ